MNPYYIKWTYIEAKKKTSGIFKKLLIMRILTDISGMRLNGQVMMRLLGNQKGILRMW